MVDEKLRQIQVELKRLGYDLGPAGADGRWGAYTRDAMALALGLAPKTPVDPILPAPSQGSAPWMDAARTQLGTTEWAGVSHNPKILEWFRQAGVPQSADEVPWCAAFVGAMLQHAGWKSSGSLMARSYLKWGRELKQPVRGCIVVLSRGAAPSGHVAFVDGFSQTVIKCLGGNQGNTVSVANYARSRVLGFRWPEKAAA